MGRWTMKCILMRIAKAPFKFQNSTKASIVLYCVKLNKIVYRKAMRRAYQSFCSKKRKWNVVFPLKITRHFHRHPTWEQNISNRQQIKVSLSSITTSTISAFWAKINRMSEKVLTKIIRFNHQIKNLVLALKRAKIAFDVSTWPCI